MDGEKWSNKKIGLVGPPGVGKTSLARQFIYGKFSQNNSRNFGLKVDKKTIDVDGRTVDLILWDIAGRDSSTRSPKFYLKGCDGIMYVVDVSRPDSCKHLRRDLEQISGIEPDAELMVVANKSDLLTPAEQNIALDAIAVRPDVVASSKTGHNVESLFGLMITKIMAKPEASQNN